MESILKILFVSKKFSLCRDTITRTINMIRQGLSRLKIKHTLKYRPSGQYFALKGMVISAAFDTP